MTNYRESNDNTIADDDGAVGGVCGEGGVDNAATDGWYQDGHIIYTFQHRYHFDIEYWCSSLQFHHDKIQLFIIYGIMNNVW